jgi:hypothetical protein
VDCASRAYARMARCTRFEDMLTETIDPQLRTWTAEAADPAEDRIMLAIQYAIAIVAALAAGLLSLVN